MSGPEHRHDEDRTGNGIVNHGPENTPDTDPEREGERTQDALDGAEAASGTTAPRAGSGTVRRAPRGRTATRRAAVSRTAVRRTAASWTVGGRALTGRFLMGRVLVTRVPVTRRAVRAPGSAAAR